MYYTISLINAKTATTKNFTVYASEAICEDYLLGEMDTDAWLLADIPRRSKALIKATRIIEMQNLVSIKNDPAQLLEFPRRAIRADLSTNGNPLGQLPIYDYPSSQSGLFEDQDPAATVPTEIELAVSIMALFFLKGIDTNLEFENLSMTSQKYGPVESTYNRNDLPEYKSLGFPCFEAWALVRPWIREGRSLDLQRVS